MYFIRHYYNFLRNVFRVADSQINLATREWVEGACAAALEGDVEIPGTPESRTSLTMTKFKVFQTLNVAELH